MKKILLIILLFTIIGSIIFFRNTIFQEGNPLPIIKAIALIPFVDSGFSKYDKEKYITNFAYSTERLEIFMYQRDYTFIEQMGNGYVYEDKEGKKIIITGKMFSRFFKIYNISN